jgi:hypothetical protein
MKLLMSYPVWRELYDLAPSAATTAALARRGDTRATVTFEVSKSELDAIRDLSSQLSPTLRKQFQSDLRRSNMKRNPHRRRSPYPPGVPIPVGKVYAQDYVDRLPPDDDDVEPSPPRKRKRSNPQTGMTAKGRRMYEHVKEAGSAYAPSAVVYAAAKRRPGTGLVTAEWAREHAYPKPNPGMRPNGMKPRRKRKEYEWPTEPIPERIGVLIRHPSGAAVTLDGDLYEFRDEDRVVVWKGKADDIRIHDLVDAGIPTEAAYDMADEVQRDAARRSGKRKPPKLGRASEVQYIGSPAQVGSRRIVSRRPPKAPRISRYDIDFSDMSDDFLQEVVDARLPDWEWAQAVLEGRQKPRGRLNPAPDAEVKAAIKSYEGFHLRDHRQVKKFGNNGAKVPATLKFAGPCKWVTYRSDKWDDGTHDYVHDIDSFPNVKCAVPDSMAPEGCPDIKVPARVQDAEVVAAIGLKALGFAIVDADGEEWEAKLGGKARWYWSPSAKALYCIDGTKLQCVIWGGKLNVEPRGIVG